MTSVSNVPVSTELAETIDKLKQLLQHEFGENEFVFTILGKGHVVAAESYTTGSVKPNH